MLKYSESKGDNNQSWQPAHALKADMPWQVSALHLAICILPQEHTLPDSINVQEAISVQGNLGEHRYTFLIWTTIFNRSVLNLILYGPRMRINQSHPGNIGNLGLQHSLQFWKYSKIDFLYFLGCMRAVSLILFPSVRYTNHRIHIMARSHHAKK